MQKKIAKLGVIAFLIAIFLSGNTVKASPGMLILPSNPLPNLSSQRPVVSVQTTRNVATEKSLNYFYPKLASNGLSARLLFKRTQVNNAFDNVGLTVYYSLGGTASTDDYVGLTNHSVYFPPNVYEVLVPVKATDDNIVEPNGETIIFTLLPDSSILAPHYNLGKPVVAKVLIADSNLAAASDMTVNNEKNITISSGQSVLLEIVSNMACNIYGGQFGGDFEIWNSGTWVDIQPSQEIKYWSLSVYPTETVVYQIRCSAPMSAPSVDMVTVNVQ